MSRISIPLRQPPRGDPATVEGAIMRKLVVVAARAFSIALAVSLALPVAVTSVAANPIQLVPNTINMFRDTRGANDVGIAQGDRFQFGANIVGGSSGTTLGATYPPTGFTVSQFPCQPLTVSPNFCSRTTGFNANRLQPWTLRFENGADTLQVAGPSLAGTEQPVPFPVNVTISGSGVTPTISWTIPGGFTPDGFRVQIFDRNAILPSGQADIIHSVAVPTSDSSYTIPAILSSGQTLDLSGQYDINFQLIETRGHVAFDNSNAEILRRSNSFFDFSPLSGGPPNVFLPTVVNGVYHFSITNVGPDSVTFIDPLVAIGYDYAIGLGDPNFASVLLPDVGDGHYLLEYLVNGNPVDIGLDADVQYFFPQGGVDAFRVAGIETSAGLDPADVTAFVTGLTFVHNGDFTGTMTPLTREVTPASEPTVPLLIGAAGLAMLLMKRRIGAPRDEGGRCT
jgi:hypothetical protein